MMLRWLPVSLVALLAACSDDGSASDGGESPSTSSGTATSTGSGAGAGGDDTSTVGPGGGGGGGGTTGGGSTGAQGGAGGEGGEGGAGGEGGGAGGGVPAGPVWVLIKLFSGGYHAVDVAQPSPTFHPVPLGDGFGHRPVLSPDGTKLATVGGDGDTDLEVYGLGEGGLTLLQTLSNLGTGSVRVSQPAICGDIPWLPNDAGLYYHAEGEGSPWFFRTVDFATGTPFTVSGPHYACNHRFSSGGEWVAFTADGLRVARTRAPAVDVQVSPSFASFSWSADGALLAWSDTTEGVVVHDVATGTPTLRWSFGSDLASTFEWAPEGRRLFVHADTDITQNGRTYLVDLEGAGEPTVLDVASDRSNPPTWSPSGRYLLARPFYEDERLIDAATGQDATPAAIVTGTGGRLEEVSHDDAWIAWEDASGAFHLTHRESGTTYPLPAGTTEAEFTADGTAILSTAVDPATFDTRYTLLSLGATSADAPEELGAFDSPGFVSLRSVQGSHYFFWEEDGPGSDLYMTLPFEGGQMKAPRQLTPPGVSHDIAFCGAHGSLAHPEARCRALWE